MEYITTKEASSKWGITATRIAVLAREGRIPGAQRLGKNWLIPASATKPPELKANHSKSARKDTDAFSFPLYPFRPDWNYIKESRQSLSKQQQSLLLAEIAVLECRFADALPMLEPILHAPDDISTEIGCIWNYGICCVALNKPKDFSKTFLRLQMLLSEDFPHRDDLAIILDILKTYVDTIISSTDIFSSNTNIHYQVLPLSSLKNSYASMTKEAIKPGTADTNSLEIILDFLKNTSSVIAIEMMHFHLLGIYYLRQDMESAKKHAKAALQIAYENNFYFPLVTYYKFFSPALSPVLEQYPKDFQKHCRQLIAQYEINYTAFFSSQSENSVISKLTDADFPYIYGILIGLSNNRIAEKLGVHPQTVKFRIAKLCQKLGVNNKKELNSFLHDNM